MGITAQILHKDVNQFVHDPAVVRRREGLKPQIDRSIQSQPSPSNRVGSA
jgi:hypothetical protein